MACILCAQKKFLPIAPRVRDSKRHQVVKCQSCGLVQLSPTPTVEEDKAFYDEGRQLKNISEPTKLTKLRTNQQSDTVRRAEFVQHFIRSKNSILDIGSGFGFFLEAMKKHGARVQGIEVSKFARKISKRITATQVHDLDIFTEDLDERFDAVTLFHVLEHISQPVEFLRRVKTLLKKRGKLVIEVPNSDDALLAACPTYRDFYWQRAHLAYYNAATLQKVLKNAGLAIVKTEYIQRYSLHNLMQWMIKGKPQLNKPTFQSKNYVWLEEIYKTELAKRKQTDTLTIIAKLK